MVKASLGIDADHPTFETVKAEFLADYENNSTVHTKLFEGIPELLTQVRDAGMQWGIVTNKLTRYAEPIVQWLDLPDCAVLVCGDTVAYSKPHPLPLQHAAQRVGFNVERCIYVGDDLRDIQAAKSAGMASIAAAYGYCGVEHPVHTWQADRIVSHANEIWPAVDQLIKPSR